MTAFASFKTATKLILFFLLAACMTVGVGWGGVSVASAVKANQEATYGVDLKGAVMSQRLVADRLRLTRTGRDAIIEQDPTRVVNAKRVLEEHIAKFQKLVEEADVFFTGAATDAALKEVSELLPVWQAQMHAAIDASPTTKSKGDPEKMAAAMAMVNRLGPQIDARLEGIAANAVTQAAARAEDSQRQFDRGMKIMLAGIIVALVIGGFFTRFMSRAIAEPLKAAVAVLGRIAKGDLTARLDLDRTDEVGELAAALNASLESMRSTLAQVAEVSTEVSSASSELASNAQAISSGAQQQAASLEETAASLEEISSTVKQNTDNAQAASQLANTARDAAERGGMVVGSAVSAMEEITRSSKKIADIIATIDEIAFQTNLLALNAAVEAARAGEQGRGFAVVAAEVRTLAQRTGTAAKEIRGLIADSSTKVEIGTQQVNESGRTLEEIVKSVKRVTDMVAEIAAASREQNVGLDQVNTAVTQVDQVTQSNAAQTEELSATATSLSDKSSQLQALVSAFELGVISKKAKRSAPVAPPRTLAAPSHSSVMPIARRSAPKKVANGGYQEF